MIKISRLAFATFDSADPERLKEYYSTVIGLSPGTKEKGAISMASPVGQTSVVLKHGTDSKCSGLAFQTDPAIGLAEVVKTLKAHGVTAQQRTDAYPHIPESVIFEGVNGTPIELFNSSPPLAERTTLTGIAPIKLGHIAFYVLDINKCVEFYTKVLGFRVSDWMSDFFVFMRCGPDHHTCNFISGKQIRMHHIAFELKDWAHVQQACDWLAWNDLKLTWGPGRHGIGHNIFTYHRNPERQIVELFTELDVMSDESLGYFDPRPWHRDRPQRPKVWTPGDAANYWGDPAPPSHRE
jgi:catechol 2,3-dioxygenase-like lactoylglutathione lyase family enzyme